MENQATILKVLILRGRQELNLSTIAQQSYSL